MSKKNVAERIAAKLDIDAIEKARQEIYAREAEAGLLPGWPREYIPQENPKGWKRVEISEDGCKWVTSDKLGVICTASLERDGRKWLHLSVSRQGILPTWADLIYVRDQIVGPDKSAIQVIPPKSKHVNLFQVLHLWVCLENEDVLPDFTHGTGSI